MKVYLAARYSRREELCGYVEQLGPLGYAVTSRWLHGANQTDDQGHIIGAAGERAVESGSPLSGELAAHNVADVRRAEILIAFTEHPDAGGRARGGRHVELGLALAWGKDVLVVGPRENVFCWLPQVKQFEEWGEDVLRHLGATEEQLEDARWRARP